MKKKIISLVLVLVLVVTILPWTELVTSAKTNLSMDDYDEIVSTYSINESILGYSDYIKQFPEKYPDAVKVKTVNVVNNPTAVARYKTTSLSDINSNNVIISYGDRYRIVTNDRFWAAG